MFRNRLMLAAPLFLTACATLPADDVAITPTTASTDIPAMGVVSAADPRAVEAGMAMLRQGGSATDAAIATMLALSVVEPQSSGIGGGGFYVHSSGQDQIDTIDGRETAPASATPNRFLGQDGKPLQFRQAVVSGLSVGVPGNLRLAEEAHRRNGKLPWALLFQPAIALARNGFEITPRLHAALTSARDRAARDAGGRALFFNGNGQPLPVGTLVRNPDLAVTLRRLSETGVASFYNGSQAAAMAARIAEATPQDGRMTAADVSAYQAKDRPPICGQYRTYRICGMGPPSAGASTVYAILKQLEHFDLTALGPQSPTAWHLFAESQRLAYADRDRYLADTDFVQVPLAGLTASDYLTTRGALISAGSTLASVAPGRPEGVTLSWGAGQGPEERGTSHFVTADKDGHVVSYTSTVEGPFGSGVMYGGFYLNNELTDFSWMPGEAGRPVANRVEGSKRPRSSMSPTIVYDADGRIVLALGAAGGSTIPVQVAKALIGVLDWKLSAQDAIALPGLYSPGDTIFIEPGSALLPMQSALEALGHKVEQRAMPFKANAAQVVGTRWIGAADPRSEGSWAAE
ncbi:gamma-glutamyltransferase [Altererythrobacter xixiisoli]|uniref:Glutathione hydrolase proenzyme n=1 Tax=Croceibacterium xixiisoli TaxID=1476466 RepID=A0A6I4TQU2_9SPHN|nr:gamma-glutamyltransferase [Croceibacterium xixiisoli]MXO97471.1 gamma-glutamyltransferase [Croceibacterium xixiisoli]